MNEILETYDEFIGARVDCYYKLTQLLVGKECTINYWKNGKNHKRKATILEMTGVEYGGIGLRVGIHRLDGQPGYLDDHSASYTRLKQVTFE